MARSRITGILSLTAVALVWVGVARGEWRAYPVDVLGQGTAPVLEDSEGNLWFSSRAGARYFDGISWISVQMPWGNPAVSDVLEDRAGRLWFATTNGVVRFDGTTFDNFTMASGLGNNEVRSLLEDRQGTIWAATRSGLSRFDGVSAWVNYTEGPDVVTGSDYTMLFEDHEGGIWAWGRRRGVSRFDGTSLTSIEFLGVVSTLYEDRGGALWVASAVPIDPQAGSLWRFDGSTWTPVPRLAGRTYGRASAIAGDDEGRLWVATDIGVAYWDGVEWQLMTETDGLPSVRIDNVFVDSKGRIWAITEYAGTVWFDGRSWRTVEPYIAEVPGTPYDFIRIHEDRLGNLWFGVNPILSFDGTTWTSFGAADGLIGDRGNAAAVDSAGNVWVTTGSGINRFDGRTWRFFTAADGFAGGSASAVSVDRAGNVWTVSEGGASRYDGTRWTTFPIGAPPDSFPGAWAYEIFHDRWGEVWFTDGLGFMIRYDGSEFREFAVDDTLVNVSVYDIVEDSGGRLWFTTAGAERFLYRYDGETWQIYDAAAGLPAGCCNLAASNDRDFMWFSALPVRAENKMYRFDGVSWATYDGVSGLGFQGVYSIVIGSNGEVWAGGPNNVSRFDGERWKAFTASDGLPFGTDIPLLEDRQGAIWFVGPRGVVRHDPDRVPPRTVLIDRPPRTSPSSQQSAAFAAAFGEASGIEFSHRFDGSPWSPWSAVRSWNGNGLADGDHVLEVRSRDNMGNIDPYPAVARFTIDATPPAPALTAPVFGAAVNGATMIRGTASDSRFVSYRIEYRNEASSSWADATLLVESTIPVVDGRLATWDTNPLPDGNYLLRLSVSDSLGLTGTVGVSVVIDNHEPYLDRTTPSTIAASSGGDVYTTNSEVHVYFPPRGFAQDTVVRIQPLAAEAVPDSLPGGGTRVGDGYELVWGTTLQKPARLTFSYAEADLPAGELAVYRADPSDGDATWERLGGTIDVGQRQISLAIERPGHYSLFSDRGAGGKLPDLSGLAFSPRVFSPTGGFADTQVGIAFQLGRPAPVSVKVFSRSGRQIREIVANQMLGAGQNLVRWDGRDDTGHVVLDGMYLVTVEALGQRQIKPLAVVR